MQLSQDVSLSSIYHPITAHLAAVQANLLRVLRDAFSLIKGIGFEKTVVEGKQIRPALSFLAGLSLDETQGAELLGVATASEMAHFASLVHDDVVDGAKTRRGTQSVNARWHDKVAVLLGDYIISQALYMLSDYRNAEVMRTMMQAVKDMAEGELRQITASREGIISEDDYFNVIQHKTSSLMGAVCKMPIQVLDGPPELSEAMYIFGFNFGMAFQIVDDLLDFVADERRLGKPILGDICEGKATLPTICMLQRLGEKDTSRIKRILEERQLRDGDKAWLLGTVRGCGATDYCQEVARDFTTRAKLALDVFPDSDYKKSMFELCDYILERER